MQEFATSACLADVETEELAGGRGSQKYSQTSGF